MNLRFPHRAFLSFSVLLLLAGCGGEPSSGDIEKVVQSSVTRLNAQLGSWGGKTKAEVHSVKKLGCKSDSSNAYVCDVEADITHPMAGRTKGVSQIRMVKGSDGWVESR